MGNDFQITIRPFNELLEIIIDNRGKTCPTSEVGIPLIATNCIRSEKLYPSYEKVRYVSEETYKTWFRGHPEPGDIIFVNKGTPGRTCLVPDPVDFCIAQDMVAVRADKSQVDPHYLFAALRSPQVQNDITNMHVGTLIPHFKKSDFQRLKIPVPSDRNVQRAIGYIYLSFSEKIELNRQMNRTLEAMAQALFKSWFIDFDPVVVNALRAGNPIPDQFAERAAHYRDNPDALYLPEDTLRQFPDRFQDSKLGPIPEGWKLSSIGTEFELTMGQSPPGITYNENGNGMPFFQGRRDFGFRYPSLRVYCTAPTRIANAGDTLVSVRAPVGDINMAYETCCVGRGVAAVRHKSDSRSYTYYAMQSLGERFKRFEAEGTVFGSINKKQFQNLPSVKATPEIVTVFETLAYPVDENIRSNEEGMQTLAKLRDTLLPKLISGELRVPDAEKLLENAL